MISPWKRANIQRSFDSEPNYTRCAKECHVDPKTVHKYIDKDLVPKCPAQREYRTRTAPLEEYWPEIKGLLEIDSKLKPYAVLEFLLDKYPTKFDPSWRRTLERRMGRWAIEKQIARDVTCSQVHQPGDVLAFDFTDMDSLSITVASAPWSGLLFHATLTHSNWEYAELCLSESYEAVVSGVQNAFLKLGGVTRRLRCDSLTAAVNNHNSQHNFQIKYSSFLEHYGVIGHRINVRKPEENGDCESSHRHLKDYLDQHLRLRGNRNFTTLDELRVFIDEKIAKRNLKRREQLVRERAVLAPLPPSQFPTFTSIDLSVPGTSIIRIKQNVYSVPSHLINLNIQSRIHSDHIELWHQGRKLLESSSVLGCAADCRDGQADGEPHITSHEAIGTGMQQDMVSDQMVAIPDGGATSNATPSKRGVREASGELVDVRQAGFGEDLIAKRIGGATCSSGTFSVLRTLRETRATSATCEARTSPTADAEEAWSIFSNDHRRHRICTTESRRDGSVVYLDCGSIRANELADQQQPSILEMGADFQRPDDDSGSDRSPGTSQHDHRAQCRQLPLGGSPSSTESDHCFGDSRETKSGVEISRNLIRRFSCR